MGSETGWPSWAGGARRSASAGTRVPAIPCGMGHRDHPPRMEGGDRQPDDGGVLGGSYAFRDLSEHAMYPHSGWTRPHPGRCLQTRMIRVPLQLNVAHLDEGGARRADRERPDLHGRNRFLTHSTIVTSQLPPGQWHDYVGDPTLADAICDRLLHNAHRIVLKRPSRRKEGKLES